MKIGKGGLGNFKLKEVVYSDPVKPSKDSSEIIGSNLNVGSQLIVEDTVFGKEVSDLSEGIGASLLDTVNPEYDADKFGLKNKENIEERIVTSKITSYIENNENLDLVLDLVLNTINNCNCLNTIHYFAFCSKIAILIRENHLEISSESLDKFSKIFERFYSNIKDFTFSDFKECFKGIILIGNDDLIQVVLENLSLGLNFDNFSDEDNFNFFYSLSTCKNVPNKFNDLLDNIKDNNIDLVNLSKLSVGISSRKGTNAYLELILENLKGVNFNSDNYKFILDILSGLYISSGDKKIKSVISSLIQKAKKYFEKTDNNIDQVSIIRYQQIVGNMYGKNIGKKFQTKTIESLEELGGNENLAEENAYIKVSTVFPNLDIKRSSHKGFYELDLYFEFRNHNGKKVKINIEIDGIHHKFNKKKDYLRDLKLKNMGINVVRFDILDENWEDNLMAFICELELEEKNGGQDFNGTVDSWSSLQYNDFNEVDIVSDKVSYNSCAVIPFYLIADKRFPMSIFNSDEIGLALSERDDFSRYKGKTIENLINKDLKGYFKNIGFDKYDINNVLLVINSLKDDKISNNLVENAIKNCINACEKNNILIKELNIVISKLLIIRGINSDFYFSYLYSSFSKIDKENVDMIFYTSVFSYYKFFIEYFVGMDISNSNIDDIINLFKKYEYNFNDFYLNNCDNTNFKMIKDDFDVINETFHEIGDVLLKAMDYNDFKEKFNSYLKPYKLEGKTISFMDVLFNLINDEKEQGIALIDPLRENKNISYLVDFKTFLKRKGFKNILPSFDINQKNYKKIV